MPQELKVTHKCGRPSCDHSEEAKVPELFGIALKPRYPIGWGKVHNVWLCTSCKKEYDTKYEAMWKEFMGTRRVGR